MWFILCAILTIIDQMIKWLTVSKLSLVGSVPLIEGVFHLTYVENRGAAFGMFQNGTMILAAVTLVEVGAILYYFFKKTDKRMWLLRMSLMMIVAGAAGNFIDRIFRGFVVDMFDFCLINFYVFNFADVCICVGVALLAFHILFLHDKLVEEGK